MYQDVPQNAQNGFRGFPSLSGGHYRQTKSLRYSFSQHIVGLVVVLEIWLLNRNSTPLFNASLVLPKHWSNPHNYNPDVSEKWGEDSCRFFVKDKKVARSSEASKFCTHPLLNTKSCQRKHASAWFVSELSLQCLKSVEQHGFWQNDLKHLEAQDSSGSFPWRSQDGRTTRPDPNSCTHTISRPGHDNLPYSACRICRQNLFWYHKAPGTCDWASSSSPQVTRCMSKYSSSLIPSKPHGAAPKARSRGSSRCRKGFSWFLYTWSYMVSIYTVQSLQDSLEQIPNLWSHRGLMKALGLQLVNSWHGSRWLIWSWTVCGELWFQNTLRCHQTWLGNPQQDVHFPSFSSKPCLIPVGPP